MFLRSVGSQAFEQAFIEGCESMEFYIFMPNAVFLDRGGEKFQKKHFPRARRSPAKDVVSFSLYTYNIYVPFCKC